MFTFGKNLSRPKEDIYQEVVMRKGADHQIRKFLEECEEALEAGEAYLNDPDNEDLKEAFVEEAADVRITGEQLPIVFSAEYYYPLFEKKLIRLDYRLRSDLI